MNLLCCQVAGGWTGLGWATPGGGQALIRSHVPPNGWVGVDRSLSGQRCFLVSRLMGSDPIPSFQIMWGSCLKVCLATYRFRHRMISGVDRPSVLLFVTYRRVSSWLLMRVRTIR